MKQFNLDEYNRLKAEGEEPRIVTRGGRDVRIICTDKNDSRYPIVALIWECDEEEIHLFRHDGRYFSTYDDGNDLFFADLEEEPKYRPYANAEECFADVKKHGGWIIGGGNQYRQITGIGYGCNSDIVKMNGCNWMIFGELLQARWADDNTPCGVKEG